MAGPILTFLSDYGTADEFVGVCHGVIARLCPEAKVIDIAHGVPRHDVRIGALILRSALPFMPAGVHLAVVDPEVGAQRRAVAVRVAQEDRILVGPDNGLLSLATARLGGVIEAVDVSRSPHRLEPVSATFHGRDIFAPVAAQLASGEPLAGAGEPLDASELATLELPQASFEDREVIAHLLYADRFGNLLLDVSHGALLDRGLKLGDEVELEVGGRRMRARYARTFADVAPGELLVYEDAQQALALAVNRGSAAERVGAARDAEIRLRRR